MKKTKKKQQPIYSTLEELQVKPLEKHVNSNTVSSEPAGLEIDDKLDSWAATEKKPEPETVPDAGRTQLDTSTTAMAVTMADETAESEDSKPVITDSPAVRPFELTEEKKSCVKPVRKTVYPESSSSVQPSLDAVSASVTAFPHFCFIYIPHGIFIMGSPEHENGRNSDEMQHEVTLTKGFYIQTTTVTRGMWAFVMGANPSGFSHGGENHPVENISWHECRMFIEKLNSMEKDIYRLPTEAEWEYACRAGSMGSCARGEILELFCGYDPCLDLTGWYCGNSERRTHDVAQKQPNEWGLYDTHGNVMEWCWDWYANGVAAPQKDPVGPASGKGRVVRGGSWFANAKNCRSASRFYWPPESKSDSIGFRLVKAAQ